MNNRIFSLVLIVLVHVFTLSSSIVTAEIFYLNGGGMMKGQIQEKKKDRVTVSVKYGTITLLRSDVEKVAEDSDPDAILDLAKYYVSREEWDSAIEEFENLLLIKPEMQDLVLEYISDINFAKSPKTRMKNFKDVAQAYQLIEEGKVLVNFGKKHLKYKSHFEDKSFEKKIHAVARRNIKKGEAMIREGQAIIDSYHRQREEEIRKAREKAEQEAKEKEGGK